MRNVFQNRNVENYFENKATLTFTEKRIPSQSNGTYAPTFGMKHIVSKSIQRHGRDRANMLLGQKDGQTGAGWFLYPPKLHLLG